MFEMKMIINVKVVSSREGNPIFEARVQSIDGTNTMMGVGERHPLYAIQAAINGLTEKDFEFKKEKE
jgi:hypothetical protein